MWSEDVSAARVRVLLVRRHRCWYRHRRRVVTWIMSTATHVDRKDIVHLSAVPTILLQLHHYHLLSFDSKILLLIGK